MATVLIHEAEALTADEAARIGRAMLDSAGPRPELSVVEVTTEATVLGAFQRPHGLDTRGLALTRRASGGPAIQVGPGTVYLTLSLPSPGALVPCEPRQLLNRYVRPLLRALTRLGALAHYFGRDWVSVARRPIAAVVFGHDASTGRSVVEAFVGVSRAFASDDRASFRGNAPGSLEAVTGKPFDPSLLRRRLVDGYSTGLGHDRAPAAQHALVHDEPDLWRDPPWAATAEDEIGTIAAGRDAAGALRLGGALLASRDVLDRVAGRVSREVEDDPARVDAILDEELSAPGVVLDGVRSLDGVRDVLVRARKEAVTSRERGIHTETATLSPNRHE